jgi:hypothetical protein
MGFGRRNAPGPGQRPVTPTPLTVFITVKAEERRRLTYKERLERLRAKTQSIRLRSDTRDIIRKYRDTG